MTDPVGEIISRLTVSRSKPKVIEKILELNLVADRKELHKRRQRGRGRSEGGETKKKGKRKTAKSSDDEDSGDGSQSNSDNSDVENSDIGEGGTFNEGDICYLCSRPIAFSATVVMYTFF